MYTSASALQNCISEATYTLATQNTVGRQMTLKNSVSNIFDQRSSIVLTFSIALGFQEARGRGGEGLVFFFLPKYKSQ